MKDFTFAILAIVLSALCSYGAIAFALFELDAGQWPTDARVICLFVTLMILSTAAGYYERHRK